MADPKVYYGIKNLYFWEYNVNEENGAITFGTPYHQESARSFGPDQDSNFEDVDADDSIWWTDDSEGPITGDLEVVRFDDDFKTRFMGYVRTQAGGLGKPINPVKKNVCVAFEYSSDKEHRREVLYNVALGTITREFETTTRESKNVKYDTLNIRCIGDKPSGLYHEVFKPGDQGYDALFTTPIVPVRAETSGTSGTTVANTTPKTTTTPAVIKTEEVVPEEVIPEEAIPEEVIPEEKQEETTPEEKQEETTTAKKSSK